MPLRPSGGGGVGGGAIQVDVLPAPNNAVPNAIYLRTSDETWWRNIAAVGMVMASWAQINADGVNPAGPPGRDGDHAIGLPTGTDELNTLRYNEVVSGWEAVSTHELLYSALTRGNTWVSLKATVDEVADQEDGTGYGVDSIFLTSTSISFSDRNGWPLGPDDVWPVGEDPPYFWLLTPDYHKWLADYTYYSRTEGPGNLVEYNQNLILVEQAYKVLINDIPYQVGLGQVNTVRPMLTEWTTIGAVYRPDPDPAPTFVQQ